MKQMTVAFMTLMVSASALTAKTANPDFTGDVRDSEGLPMPYVNVVLLNAADSSFVEGTTTDEAGRFLLKHAQNQGLLRISSIGYETQYIQVQNQQPLSISLREDNQLLGEVVVKSLIPKTQVKDGAMRTTVAGSLLEKAGTASDALNKIPQLKADKEGSVEVFGRGAAEVYINGRKVQDLRELSRLQSDQIQSVDVVSNPGARYAASTKAVVRIQLKKRQGDGMSAADHYDSYYQYGWTFMDDVEMNYRHNGLDVHVDCWAGRYNHSRSLQENDLTYYVGDEKYVGRSKQDSRSEWRGLSPQLQVNYQANENHSMGAFYKYDRHPASGYTGWLHTDNYKDGIFIERSESDITKRDAFTKHIFNGYYNGTVGKLNIDFNVDGLVADVKDPNYTIEKTFEPELSADQVGSGLQQVSHSRVDNMTRNENRFWATKLILSYPLWKGNLSVGSEYSYTKRNDAYSYSSPAQLPVSATDSEIKERMASGFLEYGHPFGKLYVQVGLRYEHLDNDYYNFGQKEKDVCRSYGDWFPTASLSMPVSFGEDKAPLQLSLSYRSDIDRPAYDRLTSSTIYINKYTFQSGNPYLKPTYTHSIVFNAAWKEFGFVSQYTRTKDVLTLVTEPYPGSSDPLLSLIHPVNSKDAYNGLVLEGSYSPVFGCWQPRWRADAIFQDYKTMTATGDMKTMNHPLTMLVWGNTITLPHEFRLDLSANVTFKGDQDNYRMERVSSNICLGVQKDFDLHKAGKFTLDLRCYDPFETNVNDVTIYGIRELTSYNPTRRTFQISGTWKFNEARSKYRGSGAGSKQKARMGTR